MASMRESDTGLWLHNKLGSADELWAPPSIASLLTASVIDNIRLCFHGLSSPVKLKLLLGILHLPRRAVDEKEILLSGRYRQGADVSPRDLSETLEGCDPSGCLAEEPEICGPRRLAQCWESQGLGGGESGSWQDVHFQDGEAASESKTKETRCIPPAAQKTSVPPPD